MRYVQISNTYAQFYPDLQILYISTYGIMIYQYTFCNKYEGFWEIYIYMILTYKMVWYIPIPNDGSQQYEASQNPVIKY